MQRSKERNRLPTTRGPVHSPIPINSDSSPIRRRRSHHTIDTRALRMRNDLLRCRLVKLNRLRLDRRVAQVHRHVVDQLVFICDVCRRVDDVLVKFKRDALGKGLVALVLDGDGAQGDPVLVALLLVLAFTM